MFERLTIPGFVFDANYVASNLQSFPIAQALNRLSAYESTLLTPAEIAAMREELAGVRAENAGLRAEFDRVSRLTHWDFERWKETVEAARAALEGGTHA